MKKRRARWLLIPAGLLLLFLILFYGPFEGFRLMWINTAMYSSRHKFLAQMFYSENYINQVLARNLPTENFMTDDTLLADDWDDDVFFAEIRGNYYRGYIIKINDPRRLVFVHADEEEGKILEQFSEEYNAMGGINASGFADPGRRGIASGIIITDGQIISQLSRGERHLMGGFTPDYKFVVGSFSEEEVLAQNYLWAFEFGPLLIVNGDKPEFTKYSGGIAPRSAIGQTAEGHILLVVIDGRQVNSIGATFQDLQTILFANGAINAINLDGGSSVSMVYEGSLVNSPSDGERARLLPNAIIFR